MNYEVKTRQTHPEHGTVGKFFCAYSFKHMASAAYYCDSYDPSCGFWMTNINDPTERKNVSEQAINRTFHEIRSFEKAKRTNFGIGKTTADDVEAKLDALYAGWRTERQWTVYPPDA